LTLCIVWCAIRDTDDKFADVAICEGLNISFVTFLGDFESVELFGSRLYTLFGISFNSQCSQHA